MAGSLLAHLWEKAEDYPVHRPNTREVFDWMRAQILFFWKRKRIHPDLSINEALGCWSFSEPSAGSSGLLGYESINQESWEKTWDFATWRFLLFQWRRGKREFWWLENWPRIGAEASFDEMYHVEKKTCNFFHSSAAQRNLNRIDSKWSFFSHCFLFFMRWEKSSSGTNIFFLDNNEFWTEN